MGQASSSLAAFFPPWCGQPSPASASVAPRCRLPADLMQHIALFLPDSATFFAFLDTFYDDIGSVLGDLRHLHRLGQDDAAFRRGALWPRLCIERSPSQADGARLNAAFKYFSTVSIVGGVDLSWVESVTTAPRLGLCMNDFPEDDSSHGSWMASCARLPFASIDAMLFHIDSATIMFHVLPAMTSLTSLHLTFYVHDSCSYLDYLDDFLPLLPHTSVKSLDVDCDANDDVALRHACLAPAMVAHVTSWLTTRRVTHLAFTLWDLPASTNAFFNAWTSAMCPTLTTLKITESKLTGLADHAFTSPLALKTLVLDGCDLSEADQRALSHGMKGARIQHLKLTRLARGFKGLHVLANWLPHATQLCQLDILDLPHDHDQLHAFWLALTISSVTSLHVAGQELFPLAIEYLPRTKLTRLKLRDYHWRGQDARNWQGLGAAMAQCQSLHVVYLFNNHITDASVNHLAQGLGFNHYLDEIHLNQNYVTPVGAAALIQSLVASSATSATRKLSLTRNEVRGQDKPALLELADAFQGTMHVQIN
ncbi:Aste57867_24581 [Aphanomyces stellatus]|uniref:Aste57867_24581 protein n=1 Tax=Aphanomyces stellatus TaxID=120398 RepID=A0A485LV43_9STRA|nr:hypothetical protein As57867_024503 [Aphanomyces stellatus]VFU01220.1 Aste57867_24581 [Aphanomyces stellatus]